MTGDHSERSFTGAVEACSGDGAADGRRIVGPRPPLDSSSLRRSIDAQGLALKEPKQVSGKPPVEQCVICHVAVVTQAAVAGGAAGSCVGWIFQFREVVGGR